MQKQTLIVHISYFAYDDSVKNDDIFSRPDPVRGIIAIRNLKNSRIYLTTTEDAVRDFQKERFSLDLGMHKSGELQNEYSSLGLELFTIELDKEAGKDEDLNALLDERKAFYTSLGVRLYP